MTPRRIFGVEKNYDWGDEVAIRRSLGIAPTPGTKIAELWWGTHPQGASRLDSATGPLLSDIAGNMTMLVKLLSCEQPLSLQTHPTIRQAIDGFAREETLGIPQDSSERMYRDQSDKPEMIVALSRFEALCGFAPVNDSIEFLTSMGWKREAKVLAAEGISGYMRWAFSQRKQPRFWRAPRWMKRLRSLHPHDPALRVAPLLNHVVLNEGEALALPAGNLHAYLHGFGLEVMNSSDNVIRAGFTTKHVDVDELLRIVDTSPLMNPVVHVGENGEYPSPSPVFTIGDISLANNYRDSYRIVLTKSANSAQFEALFLQPGTTADVTNAHGYVCIQN